MKWLLGRKCRTCGHRGIRPCGDRASETVWISGGYFRWKKFNPCSEQFPGGVNPDAGALDECGDLDDLSDCYGHDTAGCLDEIAKNGGIYGRAS